MILRKYILIFTLALISCAGTNYIHSISEQTSEDTNIGLLEEQAVDSEVDQIKENSKRTAGV